MPNITRKPRKSTQRRTGFEAGFFLKARIWMSLEHARLRPSRQQKDLEIPDRGKQKISLDYAWCRVDALPLRALWAGSAWFFLSPAMSLLRPLLTKFKFAAKEKDFILPSVKVSVQVRETALWGKRKQKTS